MNNARPRLAVRALILKEDRLLLVNAWPGNQSDLWCAPGGGVEPGASLHDNLIREIQEETGLTVTIGEMVLVNEFGDAATGYHQVDIYFRADAGAQDIASDWQDTEGVVNRWGWFTREDLKDIRYKPDLLPEAAWGQAAGLYDPLEPLVR